MKNFTKKYLPLLLAFSLFLIAAIIELNLGNLQSTEYLVNRFQKKLDKKHNFALKLIEELEKTDSNKLEVFQNKHGKLFQKEGIVILAYRNEKLFFWSDNVVIPPYKQFNAPDTTRFVKLHHAYYSVNVKNRGNQRYLALVLIKKKFQHENNFLTNGFQADFNFPSFYELRSKYKKGYLSIKSIDGDHLFSIKPVENNKEKSFFIGLSASLYFIGVLILLFYIHVLLKKIQSTYKRNLWILLIGIGLLLIRICMVQFKFPFVFFMMPLFSPIYYASNSFLLPSLGDLLFLSIFTFYFSHIIHTSLQLELPKYRIKTRNTIVIGSGAILLLFFFAIQEVLLGLINNSNILLDMNKIFQLSPYSVLGVLIISLFWASFILIMDKLIQEFKNIIENSMLLLYWGILFFFYVTALMLTGKYEQFYSLLVLLIVFLLIYRIRHFQPQKTNFHTIFIISLLTVFSITFIVYHSYLKEQAQRKVLADKLENERDAAAELILENQEKQIKRDSSIMNYLFSPFDDSNLMYDYIKRKYFLGYFNKYELQPVPCWPGDTLDITFTNTGTKDEHICHDFFNHLIEENGIQLNKESNFYFMDNMNGRISYLGRFEYFTRKKQSKTLFLALDSRLVGEELGYPELLLDKKNNFSSLENYSYAKYQHFNLEDQKGSFLYSRDWSFPRDFKSEYTFINQDGYSHLIYKLSNSNYIVISRERFKLIDLIVSLSYLLISFYIFLYLGVVRLRNPKGNFEFRFDLKTRIKFSMISILIISFIAVGWGSIYMTIKQFENKTTENISEKIQSVKVELLHKVGYEDYLTNDILEQYLKKFSQVFYTDINMYDLGGHLLSSSLPEIFEKGLIGKQINPVAYNEMKKKSRAQFITQEQVGKMSYYSIYIPFYNENGKLLSYLNLPYFTKQSELRNELISTAITIINIYIILIVIAITIAIFISNKVTKPLRMVQDRLQQISLEDSNELIDYKEDDEIGSLVNEYNRKALELAESAKKLAQSERESAWREMAKQIAHEIKNPLTPMKLNVQYFQRAWNDNVPDLDERLERFSKSLIDQINNLSSIATEFSNFAKMPEVKNEKVDLIQKLNNAVHLFDNSINLNIDFKHNYKCPLYIYADKEQITRVFTNLIKNSQQAIPEDRTGEIKILISEAANDLIVEVKDNGCGIPKSVKPKLFQPNFTTKNSGMGLGLAIVKNIVESSNGKIWYKTELDKGTSFYVKLSKYLD